MSDLVGAVIRDGKKEEISHKDSSDKIYKVEFEGRLYKIRACGRLETAETIEVNLRKVQSLGVFPVFYGRADNNLVSDFVEGENLKKGISPEDAYKIGQIVAKINTVPDYYEERSFYLGTDFFDSHFCRWLDRLCESWIMDYKEDERIYLRYKELKPEKVEGCLNYTSALPHNFVKNSDGNILVVDERALKIGMPLGSSLVKPLDTWDDEGIRNAFIEGYLSEKNLDFYYANKAFVHLYFWVGFAKAQVETKGDSLDEGIDEIMERIRSI
jgi:hypothetical protein